jgi:hypothetical protein
LHVATLHVPVEQVPVALTGAQTVPHAPQFMTVLRGASHPSVSLFALQSPKPAAQVPLQAPAAHVTVAMLVIEHFALHAPQLFTSAETGASHPSLAMLLQSL